MKTKLSTMQIIELAEKVAVNIKIRLPEQYILLKELNMKYSLPIIIQNDNYQMWVDKYYIAYSSLSEKAIHYVYVTTHHIFEEYKSYRDARKCGNKVRIPASIRYAFSQATKYMTISGKSYFISKEFEIG